MSQVLLASNADLISWFHNSQCFDTVINNPHDLNTLVVGDCLYGFFSMSQAITLSLKGVRCFYMLLDSKVSPPESAINLDMLRCSTIHWVEVTAKNTACLFALNSENTGYKAENNYVLPDGLVGKMPKASITKILSVKRHATLTIMFTDIEGFTGLNETYGDVFAFNVRKLHDCVIDSVVEKSNSGRILKFIGDGALAVFSCPYKAIQAAFELQETFETVFKQEHAYKALRVRVGMHEGLVQIQNEFPYDVFGRHVNRASRVTTLAEGGQILMSASLFARVSGWVNKNNKAVNCQFYGEHKLRGIEVSEKLYSISKARFKMSQNESAFARLSDGFFRYTHTDLD